MYIHHVFSIHSSVEGRLGCFCLSSCKQRCCGPWGRVSFGIMFSPHTCWALRYCVLCELCRELCLYESRCYVLFWWTSPHHGPRPPPAPSSVHDAHLAPSPLEYCLLPKWGPLLVSHCILNCAPLSLGAASFSRAGSSLTVSVTPAPHSE